MFGPDLARFPPDDRVGIPRPVPGPDQPKEGNVFAYNKETGERIEIRRPGPATMEAAEAEDLPETEAAEGRQPREAVAEGPTLTERARAQQVSRGEAESVLGDPAERPMPRDYATAVTEDDRVTIDEPDGPDVATREGQT